MRVYKFLSAKWAKEAIARQRLKISLLTALNDPWDGHGLTFSQEPHKGAWKRTLNELARTKGVLCFSQRWNDPVLWSHYGDQHRGIALGFDVGDNYTMDMTYRDELVDFDKFLAIRDDFGRKVKFLEEVFSTKYTNWQYESETRLFVSCHIPEDSRAVS